MDELKCTALENFVVFVAQQTNSLVDIQEQAEKLIEEFGISPDETYQDMWAVLYANEYTKEIKQYGWKIEVYIYAPDGKVFVEYAENHYEKELNRAIYRAYQYLVSQDKVA